MTGEFEASDVPARLRLPEGSLDLRDVRAVALLIGPVLDVFGRAGHDEPARMLRWEMEIRLRARIGRSSTRAENSIQRSWLRALLKRAGLTGPNEMARWAGLAGRYTRTVVDRIIESWERIISSEDRADVDPPLEFVERLADVA